MSYHDYGNAERSMDAQLIELRDAAARECHKTCTDTTCTVNGACVQRGGWITRRGAPLTKGTAHE